ncbi:MAG: hypothetical protein ACLPTB_07190 [Acidimicrobiales bacterium]
MTDERSDDEPAPEKDPSPPASDEGGIHGWRERHREKLIAEYEEAGDLRGEEEEVDDEKWKIVSENPPSPGRSEVGKAQRTVLGAGERPAGRPWSERRTAGPHRSATSGATSSATRRR